jgi:CubicO group peptidase (beta-lactamase class C family)
MVELKIGGGGFAKARLARLSEAMQGYVERDEVPGVVMRLFRHGELAYQAKMGWFDRETKQTPMGDDTLFRIASMTKPIIAVAVLGLVEEAKLRLDEPVEKWLPELANRQVLVNPDGPLDGEVYSSPRPITLRDLLTYRPGIGWLAIPVPYDRTAMGLIPYPLSQIFAKQGAKLRYEENLDPDAWMKRVGEIPLRYAPGERWLYHVSSEIMGVLLARVTGKGLEECLRERIFEPLGMRDTSFSVTADKLHRLPAAYGNLINTGEKILIDASNDSAYTTPPLFPSGGGGLISTADDYLKFARMLLNQGQLDGVRILSRKTIEAMTQDYLTPEQHTHTFQMLDFWQSVGFGFGVRVVTKADSVGRSLGAYGWGGAYGTYWINDPGEDMVAILMIQQANNETIREDFATLVYQAIND